MSNTAKNSNHIFDAPFIAHTCAIIASSPEVCSLFKRNVYKQFIDNSLNCIVALNLIKRQRDLCEI